MGLTLSVLSEQLVVGVLGIGNTDPPPRTAAVKRQVIANREYSLCQGELLAKGTQAFILPLS